jgi:hypothetical protein
VAGALGTAPVANTGTLTLNATNAVGNSVTGGTVFYNANGAAGGHAVQQANVFIGAAVTSLSNGSTSDFFANVTGLHGSGAVLAALDRGIGGGTANISFAPFAALEGTDGTLPAVQHLGTNADLTLYFGSPSALPVTVGTGTPWGRLFGGPYRGLSITHIWIAGGSRHPPSQSTGVKWRKNGVGGKKWHDHRDAGAKY